MREHEILEKLLENQEKIMADLTALTAAVAENTTAVAAVQTEVQNLQSGSDQAAVDSLTSQVQTNNTALNALVPAPAVATDTPPA